MRKVSLFLLVILFLNLLPILPLPFTIPEAHAQYEGITFDGTTGIITFNQDSTDWITDLYTADTTNNLTLLTSTRRFLCWSYHATGAVWTNQSAAANEATADDMTLCPIDDTTETNDAFYWGSQDKKFRGIYLNVTTAGVGTWTTSTMIFQYTTGAASWATLTITADGTGRFKTAGTNLITYTVPSLWVKASYGSAGNTVSAYWIRARITTSISVTTPPKGGQSWLRYDNEVPVKPAENLELNLDVVSTSFTTAGTVGIQGYDINSNPVSEVVSVSSAATFTTTIKFKSIEDWTIATYPVNASGEFTFYIQQRRWGVMGRLMTWETAKYPYSLLTAIQLGDSSTVNDISTSLQQLYIAQFAVQSGIAFYVTTNTALTFGKVKNEALKSVYDGVQIECETAYLAYTEANSKLYLYDTSIKSPVGTVIFIEPFGSQNRMWGCTLLGVKVRGINWDIDHIYSFSAPNAIDAYTAPATNFNGTINNMVVTDAYNIFAISSALEESIIATNLFSRNSTYVVSMGGIFDKNVTLINPDIDSWNFSFVDTWTGKVWRQYTFDLKMFYMNSTDMQDANVTISKYGMGFQQIGSWLTFANGTIPQQILASGFYNFTNGNAIYDYNPYHIRITKASFVTYEGNFTLTKRRDVEFFLSQNPSPTAVIKAPLSAKVNSTITLDATTSGFPTGETIINHLWDFGDGNVISGYYPLISHKWTSLGTFIIDLTVTTSGGLNGSASVPITITDLSPPTARFTFYPFSFYVNESIGFDGSSSLGTDGIIMNYTWDFGDGSPPESGITYDSYTITINSSISDGYLYTTVGMFDSIYSNYMDAWAGSIAENFDNISETLSIGQAHHPTLYTYSISRGLFYFPTTSLPTNATILSSRLYFWGESSISYPSENFDVFIQNGQPTYPHDPMVTTDYWKDDYNGNGGSGNASNWNGNYDYIQLSQEGLGYINKSGLTKLMVRSNREIFGIIPYANEYMFVYSADSPTNKPYLNITYLVPRTLPLVYHTYTAVGNSQVTLTVTDYNGKVSILSANVSIISRIISPTGAGFSAGIFAGLMSGSMIGILFGTVLFTRARIRRRRNGY